MKTIFIFAFSLLSSTVAFAQAKKGPLVLKAHNFKHYVDYFNAMEDENIPRLFPIANRGIGCRQIFPCLNVRNKISRRYGTTGGGLCANTSRTQKKVLYLRNSLCNVRMQINTISSAAHSVITFTKLAGSMIRSTSMAIFTCGTGVTMGNPCRSCVHTAVGA